jgi:amidase
MRELPFRPVDELAALVRDGKLSAAELVEASLRRIEALDPRLNAFCQLDAERALATAATIGPGDPRPFAGVPIAVKDNTAAAGSPLTAGSQLLEGLVAGHDSHVVRRLRHAGFVIVGRTTMPEFGILPVTEPRCHGACRNPWDLGARPAARPAGQPSPSRPACCRSPTATTAPARSASRPPAAGWSG